MKSSIKTAAPAPSADKSRPTSDFNRAAEIIAVVCGQRLRMRNEQFGFPLSKIQLVELDRRAQAALDGGK